MNQFKPPKRISKQGAEWIERQPYDPHARAREGCGYLSGDIIKFLRKRQARKDYNEFIRRSPELTAHMDQRRQQQTYQQPLEFQHSVPQYPQYQQQPQYPPQQYPQRLKYNFKDIITIVGATMLASLMFFVGILLLLN